MLSNEVYVEGTHTLRTFNKILLDCGLPVYGCSCFDMSKRCVSVVDLGGPSRTYSLHCRYILRSSSADACASVPLEALQKVAVYHLSTTHMVASEKRRTLIGITRGLGQADAFPEILPAGRQMLDRIGHFHVVHIHDEHGTRLIMPNNKTANCPKTT